jgi:hypothetical protein
MAAVKAIGMFETFSWYGIEMYILADRIVIIMPKIWNWYNSDSQDDDQYGRLEISALFS